MGIEHQSLSNRLHRCRHNGQTRAQHTGHFQSQRRLCPVPGWGNHVAVLVEFTQCIAFAFDVSRPQRSCAIHHTFADGTSFSHVLRWFSCTVLVPSRQYKLIYFAFFIIIIIKYYERTNKYEWIKNHLWWIINHWPYRRMAEHAQNKHTESSCCRVGQWQDNVRFFLTGVYLV